MPENIECIKYLKGFLDRRNIPYDKINHLGWIDDTIEGHIKSLERQEMNRSKLRSRMPPPNPGPAPGPTGGPFSGPTSGPTGGPTFGNTGYQGGSPYPGSFGTSPDNNQSFGSPNILLQPDPFATKFPPKTDASFAPTNPNPAYFVPQPAPNDQCTQGELGLDMTRKYDIDFDKELAELKKRNEQALSPEEAEDIRRRDARNQDYYDEMLLKVLTDDTPIIPCPNPKTPNAIDPKIQSIINPSQLGGVKNPFGQNPAQLPGSPDAGQPVFTLPIGPNAGFKTDLIESNFIPGVPGNNNPATFRSGFEQQVPNYYENSEAQNYGFGPNPASYIPPEKSYLGPNPRLSKDDFVKLLRRVGA